jgi:hypothetical protein
MQPGISSLSTRRWILLGLTALLAVAVAFATTSSSSASAGHAVAAKKKCKKKGKKSATVAKKCKKKKNPSVTPPVATPPAPKPPIVRIEAAWSGDADIDIHAWSSGLHVGWDEFNGYELGIPGFTHEHPDSGGSERIIDSANPSTRGLTFGVCNYDDETGGTTEVSIRAVYADGSVDTPVFDLEQGDFSTDPAEQGGPAHSVADWCPAAIP